MAMIDPRVLRMEAQKRDQLALMLEGEGYIKGLRKIEGIDGQEKTMILWDRSYPEITLAGREYMNSNAALKKAVEEIKNTAIAIAAQTVSNVILSQM